MIKRKQLKEKFAQLQTQEKQVYDKDGRAVIKLTVVDNDILSPVSDDDGVLISSETAEFLKQSTKTIHANQELALEICSKELDERQKSIYEKGIRNYYENSFLALQKDLKRNLWISIWLTLVGFIYFAALIIISFFVNSDMLLEMLSIFGWVFLWEAVDLFFLERPKIKFAYYRAYAFLTAEIKFKELKKS